MAACSSVLLGLRRKILRVASGMMLSTITANYLAVISIILQVDKRCSIAVRSNTGSSLWMEGRGDGGDF